jgi:mutator protein MutT
VPIPFIIKDKKILLNRRNDPHRPAVHGKWEFPGGTVEIGETVEQTLVREEKEETGYDIKVIASFGKVELRTVLGGRLDYQVYLIPYVCKIIGGHGKPNNNEVLEVKWFNIEKIPPAKDLLGGDGKMYKRLLPKLKEVIKLNNL